MVFLLRIFLYPYSYRHLLFSCLYPDIQCFPEIRRSCGLPKYCVLYKQVHFLISSVTNWRLVCIYLSLIDNFSGTKNPTKIFWMRFTLVGLHSHGYNILALYWSISHPCKSIMTFSIYWTLPSMHMFLISSTAYTIYEYIYILYILVYLDIYID